MTLILTSGMFRPAFITCIGLNFLILTPFFFRHRDSVFMLLLRLLSAFLSSLYVILNPFFSSLHSKNDANSVSKRFLLKSLI